VTDPASAPDKPAAPGTQPEIPTRQAPWREIFTRLDLPGGDYEERLGEAFHNADRRSGGVLSILRRMLVNFSRVNGAEAAATIAYYALFSLFPLLLALASILGGRLQDQVFFNQVLDYISTFIPVARGTLEEHLLRMLQAKTAFGIIGILTLLWSGSSAFFSLVRNINRAWARGRSIAFLRGRALAFSIIVLLFVLLFLSIALRTFLVVIQQLDFTFNGYKLIDSSSVIQGVNFIINIVTAFMIFFGLYRFVPDTVVRNREAFWAALAATAAWELAGAAFNWYLRSGLSNLQVVYGSLATILVFMLWIYISAMVLLLGAHLSASIAHYTRLHPDGETARDEYDID
jgi:membrane protein